MRTLNAFVSISLILFCSCALDMESHDSMEGVGAVSQPEAVNNDSLLNTAEHNGTKFNGTKFNGTKFNGTKFNGVTLSGTTFYGTEDVTGTPVSGDDFVGVDMDAVLADSTTVTVQIKAITPSGTTGLDFYTVEYYDGSTWTNICEGGVDTIPVPGVWDESTGAYTDDGTQFTFACRGAAIAKCLEWGYKHGMVHQECDGATCVDQPLDDFHLACIRMVRADYCGDGISHTEDGTLIDVWDAVGLMNEDTGVTLPFEAEWTAGGAACIEHTRWEDSTTSTPAYDYIQAYCPSRWVGPGDTTCGGTTTDFNSSVGLMADTSTRRLFRNKSDNNLRAP